MDKESRVKHFFTFVSHQSAGSLRAVRYVSRGNSALAYDAPVHFPIVTAMASKISEGCSVRVTAIVPIGASQQKNEDIQANFEKLVADIEMLQANLEVNFSYELDTIEASYDSDLDSLEKLSSEVADAVSPNDDVFCCVTFGEKTDTVALYRALSRIATDALVGDGAEMELCVYGQVNHQTGDGVIWDVTSFLFRPLLPSVLRRSGDKGVSGGGGNKRFISFVSLYPQLEPAEYEDCGAGQLHCAANPIVLDIARSIDEGETICLNPVLVFDENGSPHTGMGRNILLLLRELGCDLDCDEELAVDKVDGRIFECRLNEKSFSCQVDMLKMPYEVTFAALKALADDVKKTISSGDEIHADITFGQKTATVAFMQALAEALAENTWRTNLESCVYGYVPRDGSLATLKDVASFVIDVALELVLRRDGVVGYQAVRKIISSVEEG